MLAENSAYKFVETADGSPSLEWLSTGEAMHNRQGAFSESLAIYGSAMEESLKITNKLQILSVGLGLGYNELLATSLCLANKLKDFSLLSFENHPPLREHWSHWINSKESELNLCYDLICKLCADHYKLKPETIKQFLQHQYGQKNALLRNELTEVSDIKYRYNCILYDPFSERTNPECWEEDFLNLFFEEYCAENCVVSSYAAKGNLTRSLKKLGFQVGTPDGFAGKRNRTLAVR